MSSVKQNLGALGRTAKDKITGFRGVVMSVFFDIHGESCYLLNPGLGADGKLGEQVWFSPSRLELLDEPLRMSPPVFDLGN